MLKSFVRAAVVTAALVAIPAASQAGHASRGDGVRECRICKTLSDARDRVHRAFTRRAERDEFKLPPRDPLFKLAPREERAAAHVRGTREARRPLFNREAFKLPPRDPLFKLAPREERAAHVRSTREGRRSLFERKARVAHARGERR